MSVPDFQSLFSPSGAVMFAVGFVTRLTWCWAKNRYLDLTDPEHAPHRQSLKTIVLAWGVVLFSIVYIGVQTQAAHNAAAQQATEAKKFAAQVQDCEKQFNEAIRYSTQLRNENDALSARDRKAMSDWLAQLVAPPPNIAKLDPSDPVRNAWAIGVTQDYEHRASAIEAERQHNDELRKQHPLPDPTCGK